MIEQSFVNAQVEREGSLSLHLLHKMMLDTARGLCYLHTKGPLPVIHRDLKEDNLFVYCGPDGCLHTVKIADVGLSKVLA
jgi:serine/threonine protein kinase